MNNKEKLTRKIIEAYHGLPFEEGAAKDLFLEGIACSYDNAKKLYNEYDVSGLLGGITIGRVMTALGKKCESSVSFKIRGGKTYIYFDNETIKGWKDQREDGSEATLEDQSDETIDALLKLFNE